MGPFRVLCLAVFFFLSGCSDPPLDENTRTSSPLAPDFRAKNLRGGTSALSDFRGKVVLINFWATWCAPCRAEMPSMEALYRSHARRDFEILAISIDTMGEPSVRAYIEELGFTFPVLADPELIVNDLYHVRVAPTSFIINRKGVIVKSILGARDWLDPETRAPIDRLVQSRG